MKQSDDLEQLVAQRTAELTKAIEQLEQEISQRMQVQSALQESQKRYDLATSAGQVGIWDWDLTTDEIYVEPKLKALLGYADHEIENHLDDWGKLVHPDDAEQVMAQAQAYLDGHSPQYEVIHRMLHKDGTIRWILARGTAIRDKHGRPYRMMGTDTDVTAQVLAEEQLKVTLAEKEVLLKEIHHRVKNNLQIISALLGFQADAVQDEQIRRAFQESQTRIRSMARIHEQLYQSQDLAQINMETYIRDLAIDLRHAYGAYAVALQVDASDVVLSLDAAMPCGLIINELVSNAMKHAFPTKGQDRPGEIQIGLQPSTEEPEQFELTVCDNGIGLPSHIDPGSTRSLGLRLVDMFARQLQGALQVESEPGTGTCFRLVFPTSTQEDAKR